MRPQTEGPHFLPNDFFAHVSRSMTSGNTRFVCATLSAGYPCRDPHHEHSDSDHARGVAPHRVSKPAHHLPELWHDPLAKDVSDEARQRPGIRAAVRAVDALHVGDGQ
jgi:hypothetical protein